MPNTSIIRPIIAVIGAGTYGTALAIALSRNNHTIVLWGHNTNHIQSLKTYRQNKTHLPNIPFPPSLHIEKSLPKILNTCNDLIIAVPSTAFKNILIQLKNKNNKNKKTRIIIASKGLEPNTGQLLQNVIYKILGKKIPIGILSGPTFARELASGLPTAITLASTNIKLKNDIRRLLHNDLNFKIYSNTDTIGAQISGTVKNIIAIGVGISDGIGYGSNARAALITYGLTEIYQLGIALGSTTESFIGLSGLGDLVLTCTDDQSRNRKLGILLGKGIDIKNAQKKIGTVIEGLLNIKEVHMLSVKHKVHMPITEQVYQILCQNKNIHEAIHTLLKCTQKKEILQLKKIKNIKNHKF